MLYENYRSSKAIVAFANKLGNTDNVTNYVYEGELSAFSFEDEQQEANFIFHKMEELHNNGHHEIEGMPQYNDFAVIGRNKYVHIKIETLLKDKQIPFYYKKNGSGIENESEFMQMFELGIRILINHHDIIHLKELCKLAKYKYNASTFVTMQNSVDILQQILSGDELACLQTALKSITADNFDLNKVLQKLQEDVTKICNDEDERYLIQNDIAEWRKHWKKIHKPSCP